MKNPHLVARPSLIAVGEPAPVFTLLDQSRKEWKLADHVKERDVVLCFFPFAFTSTCAAEMKCVTTEMERWKSSGMDVVGVSCDSFASLKAWAQQEGYAHTMLSDIRREVCRAYGLWWEDMFVSKRGTVIIGQDPTGAGLVKWVQAREPGNAMNFDEVIASAV